MDKYYDMSKGVKAEDISEDLRTDYQHPSSFLWEFISKFLIAKHFFDIAKWNFKWNY